MSLWTPKPLGSEQGPFDSTPLQVSSQHCGLSSGLFSRSAPSHLCCLQNLKAFHLAAIADVLVAIFTALVARCRPLGLFSLSPTDLSLVTLNTRSLPSGEWWGVLKSHSANSISKFVCTWSGLSEPYLLLPPWMASATGLQKLTLFSFKCMLNSFSP